MAEYWDWADVAAVVVIARRRQSSRPLEPGELAELIGALTGPEEGYGLLDAIVDAMHVGAAAGIRYTWEQAENLITELEFERDNAESTLEVQRQATGAALTRVAQLEIELQKERKAHGQ